MLNTFSHLGSDALSTDTDHLSRDLFFNLKMSRLSIVDLVRQLTEDFAAAFPQSKMASEIQPQMQQAKKPKVAIKPMKGSCAHSVPATLASQLPNPQLCPSCLIQGYTRIIQDVQKLLVCRGGWSSSREKGDGHKSVRQEWRKAKIGLMNTISKLESILADVKVPSDVIASIKPALDAFDQKKVILGWVPGVAYVRGAEEVEPTEDDCELAKLMIDLLRLIIDKESSAEDKAYAANKSAKTHPPNQTLRSSGRSQAQKLSLAPEPLAAPEQAVTPDMQAPQCPGTPKSILKRKSSTSPLSSPTSGKRIRIIDIATVAPSHVITANRPKFTLLFGPPNKVEKVTVKKGVAPTSQPHAKHTVAEECRPKAEFWRPGQGYKRGPWASKGTEEKVNTSMWKASDEEMDGILKREKSQDQQFRDMVESLRLVCVTWIAIHWIRKVAPKVEELRHEMAKIKKEADKLTEDSKVESSERK